VETGQGFPELVVDMGIFASPPGTTTGQELAALRDDFMAIAPRDCRLDAETVTGQGMDWLHIAWTNRQHGYMIKDAYLCPLSRDRYLYLVGQYGGMALKPEWLAVRRQVVEDIFRSVRIEPKE
jgi:hypothetical protein